MQDNRTFDHISALPCWTGTPAIEPLIGGMTNRNYLVADASGQRYVVRVGRDLLEHGALRFNELAAARAAHLAGISPEVIFAGDGLMVSRFIGGRTLSSENLRDPPTLTHVVELLRRCHDDIPAHFRGPALIFWVFQVIRNYLTVLGDHDANLLALPLATLAQRNQQLEAAVGPVNIVFGHNDLLAANIIDDGSRLWLIDWDYAGFNTPLFDLANLASNNALTPELETLLLESYFRMPLDDNRRRAFTAMKCASLLREGLWGAVSQLTSTHDFDYARYARDYLARFELMWENLEDSNG